jgi:hypothetical protein
MNKPIRPKIVLFNAVAPLANKTPGARRSAEHNAARRGANQASVRALNRVTPIPQIEWD